ncbi:hypothetical protein BDV25DRAFT_149144 [Aspergillus avenaceus]|uniref:Uncharacterized protein n=1 Tax=Aspergillus avenaceus TaxID=36643 RepID=A0A5N6U4N3_ASPAV|nr:hypothetical protein BDV25DRAFT_149144 [Aspergillus avenaceus]
MKIPILILAALIAYPAVAEPLENPNLKTAPLGGSGGPGNTGHTKSTVQGQRPNNGVCIAYRGNRYENLCIVQEGTGKAKRNIEMPCDPDKQCRRNGDPCTYQSKVDNRGGMSWTVNCAVSRAGGITFEREG